MLLFSSIPFSILEQGQGWRNCTETDQGIHEIPWISRLVLTKGEGGVYYSKQPIRTPQPSWAGKTWSSIVPQRLWSSSPVEQRHQPDYQERWLSTARMVAACRLYYEGTSLCLGKAGSLGPSTSTGSAELHWGKTGYKLSGFLSADRSGMRSLLFLRIIHPRRSGHM